jgi:hypothetical protein
MQSPEVEEELLGDDMVVTRFSQRGEDQDTLEWLEKLANQDNVTDADVEEALAEYDRQEEEKRSLEDSYEMRRERYKREKAKEGLESGAGGFRRAK